MSSFKNLAVSLGIAALMGTGCGDNQEPEAADNFWERIHSLNYESFSRAPGYETRRDSNAPHGGAVDIYVNPVIQAVITENTPLTEWPVDSLVVKNGFDGDALTLVAAMEKRADGWFWAEYDEEGSAIYSGKPDLCINCHDVGSDFMRAFALPQ
jgi:hypothetical protein